MFHDNVNSVVSQFMFANTKFLKPHVILEHLSEVNRNTLANSPVDRIVNVQLLKVVVARIEN